MPLTTFSCGFFPFLSFSQIRLSIKFNTISMHVRSHPAHKPLALAYHVLFCFVIFFIYYLLIIYLSRIKYVCMYVCRYVWLVCGRVMENTQKKLMARKLETNLTMLLEILLKVVPCNMHVATWLRRTTGQNVGSCIMLLRFDGHCAENRRWKSFRVTSAV